MRVQKKLLLLAGLPKWKVRKKGNYQREPVWEGGLGRTKWGGLVEH